MIAVRWYVCDMDEGVLRIESTRRDAVIWAINHDGGKVLWRHKYGPGSYDYMIGFRGEDANTSVAIVREDRLKAYGLDTPPPEISPLYPHRNEPHRERDDLAAR